MLNKKVYTGLISEKGYQGLRQIVIVTREGMPRIESLFQEYVDDGKVYRITIEELSEVEKPLIEYANVSVPITAERELFNPDVPRPTGEIDVKG
ncbi:MAG: hypothetical protein MUP81_05505 [Dehalococcoidia bacterium]|nr:hypothetical protein [Dehalococcoidia bacterium]